VSSVSMSDTHTLLLMVLGWANETREVEGIISMVVNDIGEST
jgi:hypothetical protein